MGILILACVQPCWVAWSYTNIFLPKFKLYYHESINTHCILIVLNLVGLTGQRHSEMPYQMTLHIHPLMRSLDFLKVSGFRESTHTHCILIVIKFIKTFDYSYNCKIQKNALNTK